MSSSLRENTPRTRSKLKACHRQVLLYLAASASSTFAANVTSTWNANSANWGVASNWTNVPNVAQFPNNGNGGLTYDVTISSGTPSLNLNIAIQALNMSGGTIAGNSDLTINQGGSWTSGVWSGT